MQSYRPEQHPDATRSGLSAGQVALWASVAAFAVILVWQGATLPEDVPAHIGPDGQVTRWGTRIGHLVTMVVVGVMMLGSFALLPLGIRHLPSDMVNLPHKDYWQQEQNWPTAQRMLTEDMGWFGAAMFVFLGAMTWSVGQTALGTPPSPWTIWVALAVLLVGVVGYALWMTLGSRWRPPTQPTA